MQIGDFRIQNWPMTAGRRFANLRAWNCLRIRFRNAADLSSPSDWGRRSRGATTPGTVSGAFSQLLFHVEHNPGTSLATARKQIGIRKQHLNLNRSTSYTWRSQERPGGDRRRSLAKSRSRFESAVKVSLSRCARLAMTRSLPADFC